MTNSLNAVMREQSGTKMAKTLRHQGLVPVIIYGDDIAPVKIALDPILLLKQLQTGQFFSKVYQIDIKGGKSEKIIVRDVQFHPVSDAILHADFYRISEKRDVIVEVPIQLLNQDKCPGIKRGGVLNVVRYKIPVKCKPQNIPDMLELDLSDYKLGQSIHISHVTLPENITIPIERDFTIATIATPRGMSVSDDDDSDGEAETEESTS
ncbi:MAG: 50S ribosomal protein L25/general stress protein Ctc [Alphaproteobacteria bacterium]|nr:50S ribosomal protein L25/general stress protein Ctc [Alphaproteobacteria bacterium]